MQPFLIALYLAYTGGRRPATANTMASMIPITASIQAMLTAVPAMPLKPSTAAINAMIKNVTAQEIMFCSYPKIKIECLPYAALSIYTLIGRWLAFYPVTT